MKLNEVAKALMLNQSCLNCLWHQEFSDEEEEYCTFEEEPIPIPKNMWCKNWESE